MQNRISRYACNMIYISIFLYLLSLNNNLHTEVLISKDKALKMAFPEADKIGEKTLIITDQDAEIIEKKYKVNIPSRIISMNIASKQNKLLGYAVLDTHTLRTKSQTIMVIINPDGQLNYVEILAFFEPPEYKATKRWLDLFRDKTVSDDLRSGHDIPNMSGATISSNGTSEAIRRALALVDYYMNGEKTN